MLYNRGTRGCRGVAQPGSAPALGAGGRWFESSRPDHFSRVPGLERGSTYSALLGVTVHAFQPTTEGRLQNEQGRSARSPP